tara:strand:+ start:1034 stop:1552 length:519 start_codon:yes stop_codon:yes gene_type:complete
MAGSLVKIAQTTVTSAVASVTLTGISSNFDVYVLQYNQVAGNTGANGLLRFTESGTANSTANYDEADKTMRSAAAFGTHSATNGTSFIADWNVNAGTEGGTQNIHYIFNANNSSEYTFITNEQTGLGVSTNGLMSFTGGGVFTVTSTVDGINYFMSSGDVDSGTFRLYGLKK